MPRILKYMLGCLALGVHTTVRHPPPWLFPATYVAHVFDELTFGDGFPAWFSTQFAAAFSVRDFAWLNGAGLIIVTVVAATLPAAGPIEVPRSALARRAVLATVVMTNGLLHVVASALSLTAVPGVITGGLIWLPLGVWSFALLRGAAIRRPVVSGVALGLLVHMVVTLLALNI